MSNSHDDSRLTSYALNELAASERHSFETELGGESVVSKHAAAIKSTAQAVTAAVGAEHSSGLAPERRRVIDTEVRQRRTVKRSFMSSRTFRIIAATAALVLCAVMLKFAGFSSGKPKETEANLLVRRLHLALLQYQADFKQLPPDTGFELSATDSSLGAGRTYDAGSLWRYLSQEQQVGGKTYGPYLKFSYAELKPYLDPVRGESFAVIDPRGTAIGYVGDSRRVIHNPGAFDLFSAGPDRKTGGDMAGQTGAYDGKDNEGDGIVDNAQELGSARLNGCLTLAFNDAQVPREALDDVNNWDQ